MKKTKSECDTCAVVGYSPDLCKMHLRHLAKEKKGSPRTEGEPQQDLGRKVAIGAGVGVACTVAGMAAMPVFGMHALLGHLVAAKIAGVGGVTGAGANIVLKSEKNPPVKKSHKKRGLFVKSKK
ncbi:MAG: hypothetical protein V3R78_02670 [Thermodesulfobacteriota bacterium]